VSTIGTREFRELTAVVALVNTETTVIETGRTVPVTAPDQVVLAGRLEGGAVASVAVQGGSAPVTPGFELRIVGTEATLVVRPATPGGIHITDWAVSIGKPDGSVADLPVPGRFTPVPAAVPAGPPRNVAAAYREFARAITQGQPATPDFAAAVRYHQLLEAIQRASDTGVRQDAGD
jgi:predicted dehydrogenase